ncbi:MAG: hydantoinase B/oxoprolinase family protein [Firmicutes bacterium]|nr:hydantoinase B/oxoprolinase family protein [Bacillota bacterium]
MSLSVQLEIFRNVLTGVAEEMGVRLQRSAYSPNIKERRDYSCALFHNDGRLIAQAAHIPVHLGSMPVLIERILEKFSFQPGDVIIANDPFQGGTHLPDVTLVEPLFTEEKLWGFAAARAHHSDIGGSTPGSMPNSKTIYEEGIIIPPLFLRKASVMNQEVLELFAANTRAPEERTGDLYAQLASLAVASERISRVVKMYGFEKSIEMAEQLIAYSEKLTKLALAGLPDGSAAAVDYLEDDSTGEIVPVKVLVHKHNDGIMFDFTGTSPQREGNFNAPVPVTLASVYYAVRCITGDHIPANAGCFTPVTVKIPEGCVLNASKPFAVAAGNVETSQRVVDLIFKALAQILPDKIPAASCGSMNNIAIGSNPGASETFAYYETIGGGAGAGPSGSGMSAIHTHMTNTRNTSIEALESMFPFMITKYGIRDDSGGEGLHRGGDGIIREYLFLLPCRVSIISERRKLAPWGLQGGKDGLTGSNLLLKGATGELIELPGKTSIQVQSGDRITIQTPGGGGWGETD